MNAFAPVLDHSISRPLEGAALRVLSLGAGVQSSVLALMSARGELPLLDAAIFADTGWEPDEVYRWLDWLEAQLPFPIIRVRRPGPNLGDQTLAIAKGERSRSGAGLPPFYLATGGQLPKQCNADYKRDVILREIGRLARERGVRPRGKLVVEQWLGMSQDELQRLKLNRRKYIHNRWPLIELRMKRHDCLRWCDLRQIPQPPKSACIFCPYVDNARLRRWRDEGAEDFGLAVSFDRAVRYDVADGESFVHRQMKPLDEVNLDQSGPDLFDEECEGVCGV